MNNKTCGEIYLEAFNGLTELQRECFIYGFISGQAEKVYLGACKAAMFRPSQELWDDELTIIQTVCHRYRLAHTVIEGEIWIHRHGTLVGDWTKFPRNSPEWHYMRARACGIPPGEIDVKFHERPGHRKTA